MFINVTLVYLVSGYYHCSERRDIPQSSDVLPAVFRASRYNLGMTREILTQSRIFSFFKGR